MVKIQLVLALALAGSASLARQAVAQTGTGQLVDPGITPSVDPLEGNGTCDTALDLVPGHYEDLFVSASSPDFFRLIVPAEGSLTVDVTVREQSHDFTVRVSRTCDSEPVFMSSALLGTTRIVIANDEPTDLPHTLRLYRDVGVFNTYAPIEYDLLVSEDGEAAYPDLCVGDGSVVNCPCANLGAESGGCAHSGGYGARLIVGGSQFSELGGLEVRAIDLPPNTPALLFSGELVGDAVHAPFKDGILCHTGGSVIRHGARFADTCGCANWSADYDPAEGRDAGQRLALQVWYRDPQSMCGSGSNFTQAVRLQVKP